MDVRRNTGKGMSIGSDSAMAVMISALDQAIHSCRPLL